MNKMQLLVLCGGQSAEHNVSIVSAKSVLSALNADKYNPLVVYITKKGEWFLFNDIKNFLSDDAKDAMLDSEKVTRVTPMMGAVPQLLALDKPHQKFTFDAVFPVLHGPYGEDGLMQGLLELLQVPYVGCDVLSSAVCMDKDVAKRLLRDAGLPVVDWLCFSKDHVSEINIEDIVKKLELPLFVKPANLGSSVGMSKVSDAKDLMQAIDMAFRYDSRIIIEKAVVGRELEVSVLGNGNPKVSLPGEVIPHLEYYSFEAKFINLKGASYDAPAKIDKNIIKQLQDYALSAYKILNCIGMARVDFFLADDGKIYLNEINTIPGFTEISLYPKNWEATDLPYSILLDELIQLASDRFIERQKLSME